MRRLCHHREMQVSLMATPSSQSVELALRRRWRGVGRKCICLKPTFGLALAGLPLSLRALSRQSFELAQRDPQKRLA